MADSASTEAQRRQLTVMFCDMVGSTELATQLDPELLHELNDEFLICCSKCVESAGGYVARYMGDGILAYFCWPQAQEDDAERSIMAALQICESVPRLRSPSGDPLAVRVGIATGLVVVGEPIGRGAAEEHPVTGEAPNLAARLQRIAPLNSVSVSDTTRRLAGARFSFRDRGALTLKGFSQPVQAWEPVGSRRPSVGFRAKFEGRPTQFVGRKRELGSLLDLWRSCLRDGCRQVEVVGDAGIGKSRLVHEFRRVIAGQPHVWLEGDGAQLSQNTPFHAVIQMIERQLSGRGSLDPAERLQRLEALLDSVGAAGGNAAALVADLVGLETRQGDAPLALVAGQMRQRLLSALTAWLLKTAARWPTVVVLDDFQWADPSTLELLARITDKARALPLLFIRTARSESAGKASLENPRHLRIELTGLDDPDVSRLASFAANGRLQPTDLQSVLARANGVPLFAEELTRFLAARGGSSFGGRIPSTLSDLLTARLDQLGSAKDLVQVASIFGDSFEPALLAELAGLGAGELRSALARLVASNIVLPQAAGDGENYVFQHALIRDAAYDAMLKRRRRDLHRKAALAIAARGAAGGAMCPQVLAHHWTQAGEFENALEAWRLAAHAATGRGAYKEAQHALEQAVSIVPRASRGAGGGERELGLQSALAGVLQITRGYASPEAEAATQQARKLAEDRGDLKRQFAHLAGQWMSASSRGDYHLASPLADRLLPLARARGDSANLGLAHMALLTSRHRTGDLIGGQEAFESGARHFASAAFRRLPGAVAQTYGNAAILSWLLGERAKTRRYVRRMLALARGASRPYELTFGQYMAALAAVLLRDFDRATALAEQAVLLADKHAFPQFAGVARVVLGRAVAEEGDPGRGSALADDGLSRMASAHNRAGLTMYVAWAAETRARRGDMAAAQAGFTEALTANPQELYYQPEILRLRAEARARLGDAEGALDDLVTGLAAAKSMGSKLLHARLMASVALCRIR